jgi:hypothetical protein
MRVLVWFFALVAWSCVSAAPNAPGASSQVKLDPIGACPEGTSPLVESQSPQGTLRSCVVPGKEYRNVPFRHGPYVVTAPDGKVTMSGAWQDNQQHGVWRWWHPNGALRQEMNYEKGALKSLAVWDNAGRPLERSDASGATNWYPGGGKHMESRVLPGGVEEVTHWYPNGVMRLHDRTVNGPREGLSSEWFPNGQKKHEADYRAGKLVGWKGWSSNGQALTGEACFEDSDCVIGVRNECWQCMPPREAITRWQEAQRLISPPTPPAGCPEGPFPCPPPPPAPEVRCVQSHCLMSGNSNRRKALE